MSQVWRGFLKKTQEKTPLQKAQIAAQCFATGQLAVKPR
jgi:hypothetical protein